MRLATMTEDEARTAAAPADEAGLGALRTERGNLPLDRLEVRAAITGLVARTDLTQEFVNVHREPLEATYIFPLPDRAAVISMAMTADGRTVEADLQERGAARQAYDNAIAAGQRASIAEEERPDVFTMRVGNILPGERVSVKLSIVGPLAFEDGEATFRFPLVVAPRYIPGAPLDGDSVGDGWALDTDAVPDASRISPPVLLPGFPNPLRLSIDVDIDPAGLPLGDVRSSLHAVAKAESHLSVLPGERANRDFILRLAYGAGAQSLSLAPDIDSEAGSENAEGTYRLTVLPPEPDAPPRPRDVVLLLDRSGSMGGWKMVAARRAAARIVDTLGAQDRFAVLAFDDRIETAESLGSGLAGGTDRNRYRAVEHLARVDARGGTELLEPLMEGLRLLGSESTRDRVLVLVTDGQVGNEDQILHTISSSLQGTRVHTVGIDQAVNAGFLGRLAIAGGGRCELVESEDRLDEAMDNIHRRIGAPVVSDVRIDADGLDLLVDTQTPARLADIFPGVPYVVTGRYRGPVAGALTVSGTTRDGRPWSATVPAERHDFTALTAVWARSLLRDLEDQYLTGAPLEHQITKLSLRFGVLCRFTAFVAVDSRVVTEGSDPRKVTQPVESPAGWDLTRPEPFPVLKPTLASMPTSTGYVAHSPAAGGPGAPGSAPGAPFAPSSPAPMAPPPAPAMAPPSSAPMAPPRLSPAMPPPPPSGGQVRRKAAPGRGFARRLVMPEMAKELDGFAGGGGVDAKTLAAQEVARLREAEDRPEYERRELLEDLGSRLAALDLPDLRTLAAALTRQSLATRPFAELWELALTELDRVAGVGDSTQPPRKAFWKR
ncbi:VIT domain-containing protein [Dactylosporangium sp. NPDC051541]|uniref:VIT domain-containing protein n=1 Tax=Dactylosporangium sp. NPDC051541 TaxID=3363977 RepID=UPI0037A04BEB